jgi:hypothetical protein
MSRGVAGESDLLPHYFACPLISTSPPPLQEIPSNHAVDLPRPWITASQLPDRRLDNPAGCPQAPQLLGRQKPFFSNVQIGKERGVKSMRRDDLSIVGLVFRRRCRFPRPLSLPGLTESRRVSPRTIPSMLTALFPLASSPWLLFSISGFAEG